MSETKRNIFEELNSKNLNDKIKDKVGLRYLSWAYAWSEIKKIDQGAEMNIYYRTITTEETLTSTMTDGSVKTVKSTSVNEVPYFTDGKTCFVKVGATICGEEYVEILPVMDNKNNSVRLDAITMTAVNKAIQRAFVKACARHGLGLYVYAGEDLPEVDKIVVDYATIESDAEKNVVTIDEKRFNEIKAECIAMIQESNTLDGGIGEKIFGYANKVLPGKRISMLTFADDAQNIQKLHYYLVKLLSYYKK